MDRTQAAYETLGLTPDATSAEIKRAYRDLVRRWHPDRFAREPQFQHRAVEMVKRLNEAYELVTEDAARRKERPATAASAAYPAASRPYVPPENAAQSGAAADSPRTESSSAEHLATALVIFCSSWQNLLFVAFVVTVLYLAAGRSGPFLSVAGYAVQVLALPALFALICNCFHASGKRALWSAYVAVICISAAIMLIDGIAARRDNREALIHDAVPAGSFVPAAGSYGYGGLPSGSGESHSGGSPFTDGPVPPTSPNVAAPAAPMAPVSPAAPLAPVVPMAAPAR